MKLMQALPDFKPDPLAALAARQVGDMRLGHTDESSDFVLLQSGRHQVGDDFFPHGKNNSSCCCENQQQLLVQHLLLPAHNGQMDMAEIRRRRLRHWIDTDPHSLGNVEKWCDYYTQLVPAGERPLNPSYIRQLAPEVGKAARNIGEKAARRLERAGGLPVGWLDTEGPEFQESAVKYDTRVLPSTNLPAEEGAAKYVSREVTYEVVKAAVSGVLGALGVTFDDLVGDESAARDRIRSILSGPHAMPEHVRSKNELDLPGGEIVKDRDLTVEMGTGEAEANKKKPA
ncbi:hypothetical protein U5817_09865 [Aromatoleum evansii]|uniref:Uncharacterized protein n=1 Tax=Aromatoleum evansii TaxID=59406 RepID=A0ABZ1AUX3_AROEV|nr:hypothetical protein U5817_09515 [Aromatoleum evansii]WRL48332.1 hypothetical protein U5817_09865 [Aromatoleum evansii]